MNKADLTKLAGLLERLGGNPFTVAKQHGLKFKDSDFELLWKYHALFKCAECNVWQKADDKNEPKEAGVRVTCQECLDEADLENDPEFEDEDDDDED